MKKVQTLIPLIFLTFTVFHFLSCSNGLDLLKSESPRISIETGNETGTVNILTGEKNNKLLPFSFAKLQFLPAEGYILTNFDIRDATVIRKISDSPEEITYLIKTNQNADITVRAYFTSTILSCEVSDFFYNPDETISIKVSSKSSNKCYIYLNDYETGNIIPKNCNEIKISKNNMKLGENTVYLYDNYYSFKASNILKLNLSIKDIPKGYTPIKLKLKSNNQTDFTLDNELKNHIYLNYYYENNPDEIKTYISNEQNIKFSDIPKPTDESGNLVVWINDPILKLYSNKITIKN